MGISHYLAMTGAEIAAAESLPENIAYMACHFSPYGTGLTGPVQALPPKSMLILNDRIPFCGHEIQHIGKQLAQWAADLHCSCLLLDFQRESTPGNLAALLVDSMPCPVGVTAEFAKSLECPVFLSPVPPDIALVDYIRPWKGRELWLDAAPEAVEITVDTLSSHRRQAALQDAVLFPFHDSSLCCRYRVELSTDRAVFTLQRSPDELRQLLAQAETLGITAAVSLYQEMKKRPVK